MNLTPYQTRLLNGILFGNAKIIDADGRPHPYAREKSDNEEYIKWLVEEFDSVDARHYEEDDGEHEFRIPSREGLENWNKRWYYKGQRVIPPSNRLKLTSEMMSIWYARRGSWKEKYERVRLNMEGISQGTHNGIDMLKRQDIEAYDSFDYIEMREGPAREFLKELTVVPGHQDKFDDLPI